MESEPSNITTTATSAQDKWAKPEDWARFRGTITDLYMSHSLPNVIRIMREEHNFHATSKMFQVQIFQRWGLRKGQHDPKQPGRKRPRIEADVEGDISSPRRHQPQSRDDGGYDEIDDIAGKEPDAETQLPAQPSRALAPDGPRHSVERVGDNNAHHSVGEGLDDVSVAGTSGSWMTTVMLRSPPPSTPPPPAQLLRLAPHPSRYRHRSPGSTTSRRTYQSSRSSGASSSRGKGPKSDSGSSRWSRWSKSSSGASVTTTLPPGALRHLESPNALMLPEKSMFYARHYISSAFITGRWGPPTQSSDDPGYIDAGYIKLDGWYNDFNPGMSFLDEKRPKKAYRVFRRCFLAMRDAIEPQDPRVVVYIVQQAIRFMFFGTPGKTLAASLLRCAALQCRDLFTAQHPLSIFLAQLARMTTFEFALNIRAMMDCYFDHLEPFLDEASEAFGFINEMRGLTVSIMESTHIMAIHEAKPALETLVARAAKHGHSSLHLRIEIAAALQRNLFCDEARAMLNAIRASEEARSNPYEFVYAGFILMITLNRMEDLAAAIDVSYAQPDLPTTAFNSELFKSIWHSSLLMALGKLEAWLRTASRLEEADKVHARLERAISDEFGVEGETLSDPQLDLVGLG
ncbi:hypothetical protein BX600DRAFT_444449 [Xylariales sp. PMI_506]|nr:hypothetical protein BX600DRAFT_444449 [Xylariales sp. PMI_506]